MKRIVRGLAIAIIVLGVGYYLFAPKDWRKPDWEPAYKTALETKDCQRADLLLELAYYAGDFDAMEYMAQRVEGTPCSENTNFTYEDFEDVTDEEMGYEFPRTFSNFIRSNAPGSEYTRPGVRFPIFPGNRFAQFKYLVPKWLGARDELHRDLLVEQFRLSRQCGWLETDVLFGVSSMPDTSFLKKALDDTSWPIEDLRTEIRAHKDACMRSIFGLAEKLSASQQGVLTSERGDDATALFYWMTLGIPQSYPADDPQRIRDWPKRAVEGSMLSYTGDPEARCELGKAASPQVAMECAWTEQPDIDDSVGAAVNARYMSLTAQRLGYRDLAPIDAATEAVLSQECLEAIEDRVSEEAEDFKKYGHWSPSAFLEDLYEPGVYYGDITVDVPVCALPADLPSQPIPGE